jgi:PDZ domain/PEGA domain
MLRLIISIVGMLTAAALAQSAKPDIRDVPSDAGMYVQTATGFDKVLGQIVSFRRSGSLFVSKITLGIKTSKENVQLLGAHAQTAIEGKPVFYFIPPKQEFEAGVNAGDLVLIRLEEKPERRQFEVGAQGAWRSSSGISITHQIQLFRSEVKSGVYMITPAGELGKGEYALYLARGEGMTPYVYDFSVSPHCCGLSARTDAGATPQVSVRPSASADNSSPSEDSNVAYKATAEISSEPLGADIEIDGKFIGNTPSSVGVGAGDHVLRLSKHGYKSWERHLQSSTGTIKIAATLESIPVGTTTSDSPTSEAPPSGTSIIRNPLPAEGTGIESRIGVWFTGNPLVKHDGLEIAGVQPSGPADKIDIQPGDVIIALDGHYLYTIEDLRALLRGQTAGKRLSIRYRRNRLTYDSYLVIGARDAATSK